MSTLSICFSSDDNYAQHLGVAICSILKTNPQHQFHFYILDGGISAENKGKIVSLNSIKNFKIDFIPVRSNLFQNCPVPKNSHFSKAMFYRWHIISLFPNLDKILYLDCDLVVLKDLKPLFDINLKQHWMAMTPDCFSDRITLEQRLYNRPYYNSGVILFNLNACRQVQLGKRLFQRVKTIGETPYGDQDILNDIAGEYTFTLEQKFNTQFHPFVEGLGAKILDHISDVVILHYTSGLKPWTDKGDYPLNMYYFKYLKFTPWKKAGNKMKLKKIKRFFIDYIKTDKSKKWKICGITVFKKTKKRDYSRKFYVLGIPVWKTPADKWHLKYDRLLAEQALYKTDVEEIQKQLAHLDAIKLLHNGQK